MQSTRYRCFRHGTVRSAGPTDPVKRLAAGAEAGYSRIDMRPQLWKFERRAQAMGYEVVAGVDEVGMGPLAGPVVAGAVVLKIGDRIPGLNDSKLMTADERERVDKIIRRPGKPDP